MTYVSTDVDKILDYVKRRGRAELIEVARALNIRAGEVDKWAKVLEKEGLIQIEYNITKTYMIWAVRDSINESAQVFEAAKKGEFKDVEPPKSAPTAQDKPYSEKFIEKKRELEKLVIPKLIASGVAKANAITEKVRKRVEGEQKPANHMEQPTGAVMFMAPQPPNREREAMAVKTDPKSRQKVQKQMSGEMDKANELSLLLKNKIEAINATIAEISDLKSEKEKLYSTEYVPLISRLDTQLSSLSERLAEREAAVLALKKRIVDLSDSVAKTEIELQDASMALNSLEKEYARQLGQLSSLKMDLVKFRESIKDELERSRNIAKSCMESLSDIQAGISSINSIKEQALARIKEAQKKIDEEQAVVEKMTALIDSSQTQVDKLKETLDSIMERARQAESTIQVIQSYELKVDSAEKMIAQVESAYSKKIAELKSIIEANESEINSLRVEIAHGSMQKYLSEISRLSEETEQEATAVAQKEQEIELRLKTARERLQQMLKESRELSKKFEESV